MDSPHLREDYGAVGGRVVAFLFLLTVGLVGEVHFHSWRTASTALHLHSTRGGAHCQQSLSVSVFTSTSVTVSLCMPLSRFPVRTPSFSQGGVLDVSLGD